MVPNPRPLSLTFSINSNSSTYESNDPLPVIFFHGPKPAWKETPPTNTTPQTTFSPLEISVSNPTLLRTWLGVLPAPESQTYTSTSTPPSPSKTSRPGRSFSPC